MQKRSKMMPKWSPNGNQNEAKIGKRVKKGIQKSMLKIDAEKNRRYGLLG